jgi:geranylgeranyl diphosphate/geranylgeranyl-bacteriochlorophyllide a reductase
MKTVAVLGGGPAGSFAAERLARAGLKTIVFDEKLAWEKPCGGGLTFKAYDSYPFLIDNETPKKFVTTAVFSAPGAGPARIQLEHPLLIFSRFDLNNMLLCRAEAAGAQLEKERVIALERNGSRWALRTRSGTAEADFLVVANGARNALTDVGTQWTPSDVMYTLGYYVPASQEHIDIQFLKNLEGYIWVFPRCGHLSVGICGKGEPASALRARLETYMQENGIPTKGATFFGHVLPSLERKSWRSNRVAGEGWVAVGDAAGLVDPLTGEGLYYAMRSGDLASQVLTQESPLETAVVYRRRLAADFGADLEVAARYARRFFCGNFLWGSVTARLVQFSRGSRIFAAIVADLVAGKQSYAALRSRLRRKLPATFAEIAAGFIRSQMP